MTKISEIRKILNGTDLLTSEDNIVVNLLTDSRKLKQKQTNTLFIAINGINHNAHDYLHEVYLTGVRNFIVEEKIDTGGLIGSNIILVNSSIEALQKIGKYEREQSSTNVIGITGSNGKTIIKEWLHQCLSISHSTVKSPGSYNSQIGVPLSLWNIEKDHEFAIIEAGISKVREMDKLAEIINPNNGFEIADVDLKLRGPGDMTGTQQSGVIDLKIADISKDAGILKTAREIAYRILDNDSALERDIHKILKIELAKRTETIVNWSRVS